MLQGTLLKALSDIVTNHREVADLCVHSGKQLLMHAILSNLVKDYVYMCKQLMAYDIKLIYI